MLPLHHSPAPVAAAAGACWSAATAPNTIEWAVSRRHSFTRRCKVRSCPSANAPGRSPWMPSPEGVAAFVSPSGKFDGDVGLRRAPDEALNVAAALLRAALFVAAHVNDGPAPATEG